MNRSENVKRVLDRIFDTCHACGRNPEEVKLVAVSKTFQAEIIREVYDTGLRIFGESRAQEFRDKAPLLPDDIEWHFIGHLQTNKIKYVVPNAEIIHSVDTLHLAHALSDFAVRKEVEIAVLMEVNVSEEASKFGTTSEKAVESYHRLLELPGLAPRGLMTIAPYTEDEKEIREAFIGLRQIQEILKKDLSPENTAILSMGMSHDFKFAIEEGSNMVRIGSAIFGQRGR
jgi:pyridoxal phosphate enzyme (YggS family)